MVINRGDVKRKRKEDSFINVLDGGPKRTKVHAQRKFVQGSNVSSPVITPVKEIEKQDRNRDVLPEPIELLPIKRPNTEDFLTFLCFRGTPILPSNLNFFNTVCMIDSRSQSDEPKNVYPNNGPILTTSTRSHNERPFIAFGVRKRADPVIISKQMDRKRRHALALQALRRKYQEQKMAKIRAVTISKLSEKVIQKNVVKTRSITKNETITKKTHIQKADMRVITTKHLNSKTIIKQPLKSKMCLRSFRGRFIHRELNIQTHRKRAKIPKGKIKLAPVKQLIIKETLERSSSEFSSDDDEPLMKSVKTKTLRRTASTTVMTTQNSRKSEENIRLTRSHNKRVVNQSHRKQSLQQKRIITRFANSLRPTSSRLRSKKILQTSSIIKNLRKSVSSLKREQNKKVNKTVKSLTQQILKNKIENDLISTMKRTRSKCSKLEENCVNYKKESNLKNIKLQTAEASSTKDDKFGIKNKEVKSNNKEINNRKKKTVLKVEKLPRIEKAKMESKIKSSLKNEKKHISTKENYECEKNSVRKDLKKIKRVFLSSSIQEEKKSKPTELKKEKSQNVEENKNELAKRKINVKRSLEKISNSRPTRKTKEAAAIYMEILGHKLVNDNEIDDDNVSIDSFPELPNVRKTEQRENELKAKARSKSITAKETNKKTKENETNIEKDFLITDTTNNKTNPANISSSTNLGNNIIIVDEKLFGEPPTLLEKQEEESIIIEVLQHHDTTTVETKRIIKRNFQIDSKVSSDESNKVECKIYRTNNTSDNLNTSVGQLSTENSETPTAKSLNTELCAGNDNFDESNMASNIVVTKNKKNNLKEIVQLDQSFSDSDEEPLSNLTKTKDKIKKIDDCENIIFKITENPKGRNAKDDKLGSKKMKRECTKKNHNYLPFSSSDDEEKYFHGFVKTELKTGKELNSDTEKCPHSLPSDLSCKDVSRRYGKGKVNMSNEQIEKWLNDSAMAGMNIKKEEDELLKFEDKLSSLDTSVHTPIQEMDDVKLTPVLHDKTNEKDLKTISRESEEDLSFNSTPEKVIIKPPTKTTPNERKTIFKKEKTEPIRNVNAFSVSNECSVYAFQADNEDSISTPFRRPSRRPSSTATSKSEDEAKIDDLSKSIGKFRLPTKVRSDYKILNKQEVSNAVLDDSSNANSVAQVSLETHTFTDNSNSECPSLNEDTDHVFYTSIQTNKQVYHENTGKAISGKLTNENVSQKCFTKIKPLYTQTTTTEKTNDKSMFPPTNALQKGKSDKTLHKHLFPCKSDKNSETSDDLKYKIPSSPSASSSSSAKLYNKRQHTKIRNRILDFCTPVVTTEFPNMQSNPQMVEAPVFHPSDKEFQDPLEYIEKIRSTAEKFGICRIVPPANFKPECKVSDDMRFTAYNQYVHKMLHRWGPNFKELMAIKKYLDTQNIILTHPPWIGGMEIDLPRLYQIVQSMGGLKEVIEKKKWSKVSEAMKIPKSAQDRVTKLDDIYCKYLLPYDTLSPAEREKIFDEVETEWAKRESKTLLKIERTSKLDSSNTDMESESDDESEECIVKGRNIALNAFYRIARNTMSMWFKTSEPTAQEVEQEYWKHVTLKNNHICVHSGSIDSGNWGYGFAVSKNSPFARHAWNLKVLTNNSGSVLRSMGPIMGVTVPTLHVGMVFSACCWYRDPHSLPWIEYLHTGAHKIWYGIPDSMSKQFHSSMLKLVPNYCRNKSIWLPSDTVMIPPKLLVENGVSLCRTVQEPGQFIVVFPKVFTSCVSTGYVVSESVYFAPLYWIQSAREVFNELRSNCEPSMFSIDRLLISIISDARSTAEVLKQVLPSIQELCCREKKLREKLRILGVISTEKLPPPEAPAVRKRKKLQDSGDYECEICRTNLFVSLVNECQEDVVYCLEHVIEYIEQRKVEAKNCKLLFTYECEELDLLVDKVKNIIEMKQQKKLPSKLTVSLVNK